MLIGQYTSKVDAKRRVAVPSKFRDELGNTFILTRWYESCLSFVAKSEWLTLFNKLIGETKGITAPVRDTNRFLLGQAYELTPDGQGRVVIPEGLAKFAQINAKVIFLGLGDRVEVWGSELWDKREAFITENADKFVEDLTTRK